MAESILQRAYAKRDAALREAAEWEAFIQRYHALSGGGASAKESNAADLSLKPIRSPSLERNIPPDSELGKTITLTEEILNECQRPVPLGELYEELTKRGLIVGGKTPRGNLGARLNNSGRFQSISKSEGWWFKDRPIPVGNNTEDDSIAETPNSGELFGAPKTNGAIPLSH